MEIQRAEVGQISVLRLIGDLDEDAVDVLRAALFECLKDKRFSVVMNFTELRFISYMGLGVLVERLRYVRQVGGDIKLVGINLYAERLFRMVGVSSLFEIYDSETRAIGVFQEAA